MIRGLVWDMGGVLVREEIPPSRTRWEKQLGLSEGELTRMVFWHPLVMDLLLGRAKPSDMWRLIEVDLGLANGDLDALEQDFWGEPQWQEEVWACVRHFHASVKQGVLSDAWPGTREIVGSRINEVLFDVVVFSAEEGVKKPQAAIYSIVCTRLSIVPNELIFIDDRLANVEGARRRGMWAIEFSDPNDIRSQIDEIMARQGR